MTDFGFIGAMLEMPTHLTQVLVIDHAATQALNEIPPHFAPGQMNTSRQVLNAGNAPVAGRGPQPRQMAAMQPVNEGPVRGGKPSSYRSFKGYDPSPN